MNRSNDLYLLDRRAKRNATIIIAVGLLAVLASVLSVQCGKPAPVEPKWPPPPAVVDALPVQVTPTLADPATPAADPSPVTTTAVWHTDPL